MGWGRKRPVPSIPARMPHPDPRVEAVLQRVISAKNAIGRREAELDQHAADIATMQRRRRRAAGGSPNVAADLGRAVAARQKEMIKVEEELAGLHADVATWLRDLGDDALYL